jgi:hypothetical protein
VTPAKENAIRGEFMRQCDKMDGRTDGIINNYIACLSMFDVTQSPPNRQPWATKRCPDNIDANPTDTSPNTWPHRRPDFHASVRLQPLSIEHSAGKWCHVLRYVAPQYRSQRATG